MPSNYHGLACAWRIRKKIFILPGILVNLSCSGYSRQGDKYENAQLKGCVCPLDNQRNNLAFAGKYNPWLY